MRAFLQPLKAPTAIPNLCELMINLNKCVALLSACLACTVSAYAQRSFVALIDQQPRSYNVIHLNSNDETYNLPLIILACDGDFKSYPGYMSGTGIVIAKPNGIQTTQGCADATMLQRNITFLETVIQDTYSNFKTDRNRVYIISDRKHTCLADSITDRKPGLVTKVIRLATDELITDAISRAVSPSPIASSPAEPKYALWKKTVLQDAEQQRLAREDSIRRHRWAKRTTLEFRMGRFDMLGSVKTAGDQTYMDVTDAHTTQDIHITRWMTDSTSWFVDIGRLKVPQHQEFNGARIEMGGGMIFSITYGLRYTFYRRKLRPYVMLGTGPLSFMVFGGRFSENTDPQQIRHQIEAEVRMAMQTKIGIGIEGRLGKRIALGAHAVYIHSSEFKSAGSVNAIRGFSNSLSIGYILGANKVR